MGELINLNPQGGIPDEIARDSEVAAAIATHVAAADPHPQYLNQTEGDGRYRQTATPLTDADIPAAIARDSEVATAINNHLAATNPHPFATKYRPDFGSNEGNSSGFYESPLSSNAPPSISSNWVHLIECRHSNPGNNYALQIAAGFFSQRLYFRSLNNSGSTGWSEIWHEGNFNPSTQTTLSKLITGNCPSAANSNRYASHGLDVSKITGYTFMVLAPSRGWILPESNAFATGQLVYCALTEHSSLGFFILTRSTAESGIILGQPFKILVFYSP